MGYAGLEIGRDREKTTGQAEHGAEGQRKRQWNMWYVRYMGQGTGKDRADTVGYVAHGTGMRMGTFWSQTLLASAPA